MILFTRIYPKSETLKPVPQWGRYHHLKRWINDLTFSEDVETISDMIHRVVRLCVTLSLLGSVSRSEGWVSLLSRGCVGG